MTARTSMQGGRGRRSAAGGLRADVAGQMTLEWTMVLAFIALPMYFVIKVCLSLMVAHYRMVSFLETIPFP